MKGERNSFFNPSLRYILRCVAFWVRIKLFFSEEKVWQSGFGTVREKKKSGLFFILAYMICSMYFIDGNTLYFIIPFNTEFQ